jgi:hypothetical protein
LRLTRDHLIPLHLLGFDALHRFATVADPRRPSAESRQRTVNLREVVKGVMYVLSTGCPCEGGGRCIPRDLPPRNTVNGYFGQWGYDAHLRGQWA